MFTAAVLKLYPGSMRRCAWLVIAQAERALDLQADLHTISADSVTSFEYMSGDGLTLMLSTSATRTAPLIGQHHVLVEMLAEEGDDRVERALTEAHHRGLVEDVIVAQNETRPVMALARVLTCRRKATGWIDQTRHLSPTGAGSALHRSGDGCVSGAVAWRAPISLWSRGRR